MTTNNRDKGFTLIELLLAMSFIAFLLLFMVAAILQVTKLYVKGSAIRQINQTGRQIIDDVSSDLRSNSTAVYAPSQNRLCVGNTSYIWNVEGQTINSFDDGSTLRLISVQDPNGELCASSNPIARAGSVDLVGADITPLSFSVGQQGRLWKVSLVLSTAGSNIATADASTPSGFSCASNNQFCAFGDFQTTIYSRGGL
jgi:prepilin-type N-terminal cleavage/methylation domain-containing protein